MLGPQWCYAVRSAELVVAVVSHKPSSGLELRLHFRCEAYLTLELRLHFRRVAYLALELRLHFRHVAYLALELCLHFRCLA